jgi:antitoxin CptB
MARRSLSSGRALRADPLAGHDNQSVALYIRSPGTSGLLAFGFRKGGTMTERSSQGLDVRRRRLLFRAWRRGVRETDLIVGRFADAFIDKFDEASLDQFERLIEVPNESLYAWVVGAETVPADYDTAVLHQLIGFHASLHDLAAAEPKA